MQPSNSIYPQLLSAAVSFQLVTRTHALPAPLPPWLADMIPQRGANITSEIKCYSLPYGGIGFLSLVAQNIDNPEIRNITILFGALVAFSSFVCFLYFFFPSLAPTILPEEFGRRPSAELAAVLSVRTLPLSLPAAVLVLSALY